MKKIISLVLVLVLALTAIGGTLAYFTDTDAADNVFTVGNIDIKLIEEQRKNGETGDYVPENQEDFVQNKELMPGTSKDKIVTVQNTGANPAYVKVTIVIPENMTALWPADGTLGTWTREPAGNGAGTYVYKTSEPLNPDATTPNLLLGVMLNGDVTKENVLTEYHVPVNVAAIQSEGFNSAAVAYAELEGLDVVEIATAEELFAFAKDVNENGNSYAGKTVILTADINLENKAWTPVGQTGATQFKGVFDGNNKTISNLTINNTDESANCSTGLFGWIESHGEGVTVKNLTIDGANVTGHHYVGAVVGYVYGTVENCHVKNATISCTSVNDDANGDKAGLIAGYVGEDAKIAGCTGSASTVNAGRDGGQIVGAAKAACVTGCSASGVTVTANDTSTGANIRNEVIGRVL